VGLVASGWSVEGPYGPYPLSASPSSPGRRRNRPRRHPISLSWDITALAPAVGSLSLKLPCASLLPSRLLSDVPGSLRARSFRSWSPNFPARPLGNCRPVEQQARWYIGTIRTSSAFNLVRATGRRHRPALINLSQRVFSGWCTSFVASSGA
jgi:hypothetical protein